MAKVTTLKKPNPKGEPPTPAASSANLIRPAKGESVPFQVRIPGAIKSEFKAYAAARDLTSSLLFLKAWEFYKEHHT